MPVRVSGKVEVPTPGEVVVPVPTPVPGEVVVLPDPTSAPEPGITPIPLPTPVSVLTPGDEVAPLVSTPELVPVPVVDLSDFFFLPDLDLPVSVWLVPTVDPWLLVPVVPVWANPSLKTKHVKAKLNNTHTFFIIFLFW